ncbi:MAG TPA: cyclase family protein [Planctomycetota bacterium]|nr:cyclase family protein [Planctomycetota bacterium]
MKRARGPRLIDVSQPVDATTACWPGDTPFASRWVLHVDDGASCTLSRVTTSPHNGTHADAPSHFLSGAPAIDEVPVEKYVGGCRVVERIGDGPVTAEEARRWRVRRGDRILLRSRRRVDARRFPARFAHLTGESAGVLAAAGAVLFGIDTPSVDHRDSKTLDAHKGLFRGGVAILENLDLSKVRPGRYRLLAAPIRLRGLDAGPVRALLER